MGGSLALPHSSLWMVKRQALMVFPTGRGPPEDRYFHRVAFGEGRVVSGLRSHPCFHPCPAVLSVTWWFNAVRFTCCMEGGQCFGLISLLRLKSTNNSAQLRSLPWPQPWVSPTALCTSSDLWAWPQPVLSPLTTRGFEAVPLGPL